MAGDAVVGEVEEASNDGNTLGEGVRSATPTQQSTVQAKEVTAPIQQRKVKKPMSKPVTHPVPMKGKCKFKLHKKEPIQVQISNR